MTLFAIDPGNEDSAWLAMHRLGGIEGFGKVPNRELKTRLARFVAAAGDHLAIEMIASYGMPVGREVFDTCVWIGRFVEAWGKPFTLVYRREVKMHLCGNNSAKDGNIRAALIDRYGPGKRKAIGLQSCPGPLYGIAKDVWSALAIAVTWSDAKIDNGRAADERTDAAQ